MEKYSLKWWTAFHDAIRLLARLDAFEAFDTLTRELLADSDDLQALHTATQWFVTEAKEG